MRSENPGSRAEGVLENLLLGNGVLLLAAPLDLAIILSRAFGGKTSLHLGPALTSAAVALTLPPLARPHMSNGERRAIVASSSIVLAAVSPALGLAIRGLRVPGVSEFWAFAPSFIVRAVFAYSSASAWKKAVAYNPELPQMIKSWREGARAAAERESRRS